MLHPSTNFMEISSISFALSCLQEDRRINHTENKTLLGGGNNQKWNLYNCLVPIVCFIRDMMYVSFGILSRQQWTNDITEWTESFDSISGTVISYWNSITNNFWILWFCFSNVFVGLYVSFSKILKWHWLWERHHTN